MNMVERAIMSPQDYLEILNQYSLKKLNRLGPADQTDASQASGQPGQEARNEMRRRILLPLRVSGQLRE